MIQYEQTRAVPATISAANARLPQTYETAKNALAECQAIDECQTWADKAAALASYAKQANDDELMRMATRIRDRAIRRAGELLKQIVDFHREVTRAGARFPLRIDPCETLPLAGIVGGYRSDRHGVFDYYPALGTA